MSLSSLVNPDTTSTSALDKLWCRLECDLRHPVVVERRSYGWRIEVMGSYRVGLLEAHREYRMSSRRNANGFADEPASDMALLAPLPTGHWLRGWLWWRWQSCGLAGLPSRVEAERLALELLARIPAESLVRARMLIREALPLDPDVLALARRSQGTRHLTLSHYCKVWRSVESFRERARESMALLPLFDVFRATGCDYYGLGFKVVRNSLHDKGLSHAGWRQLCDHGSSLWAPLRHSHEFGRLPVMTLVDWANRVAAMQVPSLPPARLALAWAMSQSMGSNHVRDVVADARMLRAARRELEREPERRSFRHKVSQDVRPVLQWWEASAESRPTIPPRAGWRWFKRHAALADWARVAARLDETFPGEPDRHVEFEGIRFTRHNSRASLFLAGLAFRNCLAQVPGDHLGMLTAERIHYSLCDAGTGRLLAMLMMDASAKQPSESDWELRGPCNQTVGLEVRRMVGRFMTQVDR